MGGCIERRAVASAVRQFDHLDVAFGGRALHRARKPLSFRCSPGELQGPRAAVERLVFGAGRLLYQVALKVRLGFACESPMAIRHVIDYMRFRRRYYLNGELEMYDADHETLLGRCDPYIPVNIMPGPTARSIDKAIAELEGEARRREQDSAIKEEQNEAEQINAASSEALPVGSSEAGKSPPGFRRKAPRLVARAAIGTGRLGRRRHDFGR